MKIMHIVGNRPQFIKLAPISTEIRNRNYRECIIHTGQHFDANMSDIFFEELGIPTPDENLHVSGGSHTEMTARIMLALEPCIKRYNPDVILIYGDTNSTLAAALTARKAGVPIVHVEAVAKNWEQEQSRRNKSNYSRSHIGYFVYSGYVFTRKFKKRRITG